MRIEIVIPPARGTETGNRHTARQWAAAFVKLGHEVSISEGGDELSGELLVVLHALKSWAAIRSYRKQVTGGKLVVCLSGTDIYGNQETGLETSMREADRLVVLQQKALERVPAEYRGKTRVIVQGMERRFGPQDVRKDGRFQVCVVGHLREVKDPLRTAQAARLLPAGSKVEVVQAGGILEEGYQALAAKEAEENPRYRWVGELPDQEARRLIAESDLMVISSFSEGGARVVGEAVVEGTPIVASRIDGTSGLLGEGYPGYFEAGDTEALAELIGKAETDPDFLRELKDGLAVAAPLFDPRREVEAWADLLADLQPNQSPSSS